MNPNPVPEKRNIKVTDYSCPFNDDDLEKYGEHLDKFSALYSPYPFLYDKLLMMLVKKNILIYDNEEVDQYYLNAFRNQTNATMPYVWFPLSLQDTQRTDTLNPNYDTMPPQPFRTEMYGGHVVQSHIFGKIVACQSYPLPIPVKAINIIRDISFAQPQIPHLAFLASYMAHEERAFLGMTFEAQPNYNIIQGRRIIILESWNATDYKSLLETK